MTDKNGLSGTIPSEIGLLINIIEIDIDTNALTGSIPTEFGNLEKIVLLDLDENKLTGTIPTEFGRMTSARKIEMCKSESYILSLVPAIEVHFSMFCEISCLETQSNTFIISLFSSEFHIKRHQPALRSYSD